MFAMDTKPPARPRGDMIDIEDPAAIRAWAAWLNIDEGMLLRVVRIVGCSAGQIEFLLGRDPRSRW